MMHKPIPAQRIGADLVKALGLPKMTKSFTLHVAAGECVTVSCEYYPEDGGIVPALAVYDLVERPAPQSSPAPKPASQHFDTWMRERIESAHREFMGRTSHILNTDFMGLTPDGARAASRVAIKAPVQITLPTRSFSIEEIARYMGVPV